MQPTKRLLRLKDVQNKVGLRRDSIYRGIAAGWFPRGIKISARATGWLESEVDDFIESRIAAARKMPVDAA